MEGGGRLRGGSAAAAAADGADSGHPGGGFPQTPPRQRSASKQFSANGAPSEPQAAALARRLQAAEAQVGQTLMYLAAAP